jgi:lysophospholipase
VASFRALNVMTPDKRHLRAGIWELPLDVPKSAICVVLNGHTEFLEKYEEVAGELKERGFEVVSLDWRGQGASERRSYGNRAGHIGSFEEYDSDLAALLLQVIEPIQRTLPAPIPVIGLAHSMGAHVLLRFLHEHKRRFAAAVLLAPMLEVHTGKYSPAQTQMITTLFNLRKPSTRMVFGIEERDPLDLKFEENAVTSDRARFERTQALIKAQPFLRIFGPTFGWLGAALSSMRRMKRPRFAQEIATPLLVVAAGHDRVVQVQGVRDFVKNLPNARYVEIEESEHEILMENDSIRARFWAEFDAFVKEQLRA